jgi:hypothetical protein
MYKSKKIEIVMDSLLLNLSMEPFIPLNAKGTEPMELIFIIDDPEGTIKPLYLSLNKEAVVAMLKELQRLTPLIKCFG